MVEVFRKEVDLYGVAEEAIAIGAKVLWGQIGVIDHKAARLAEEAGLKVVMDRCPKMDLGQFWIHFWASGKRGSKEGFLYFRDYLLTEITFSRLRNL